MYNICKKDFFLSSRYFSISTYIWENGKNHYMSYLKSAFCKMASPVTTIKARYTFLGINVISILLTYKQKTFRPLCWSVFS